jgi:hypothetical protein
MNLLDLLTIKISIMKALHSLQNFFATLIFCSIPFLIVSCATQAIQESPMRFGYAVDIAPGLQLGDSKTSAHVLAGYGRIGFKGGGGHNNLWQFGAQVRQSFSYKPDAAGFWAGGEATYLAISNKYDNSTVKATASGFTIGPIAGYRFLIGTLPLSIYAAPAFLHRGKFTINGMSSGQSHSGFLGRLGLDIHFASLLSKKGR